MFAREALGIALLVLQTIQVIPIVARLVRSRSGIGVSAGGEAAWAVAGIGWSWYGFRTDSWILVISGGLALLASGTASVLLWRLTGADHRGAVRLAILTSIAITVPTLIVGTPGLSTALAIFGVVQFLPQARTSWAVLRSRIATPGVSVVGALVRAVYTFGWAVFGGAWMLWEMPMSEIDWPIVAWGLAGAVTYSLQAVARRRGVGPVVVGQAPQP